jgi:hypothetical protein
MNNRHLRNSLCAAIIGMLTAILVGCGILDGYQREHHFKDEESTALILDAKQRVITQRSVKDNPRFEGRLDPGIVVCAEPSPDVANALSSALSTSLNAALPSASGTKNLSADFGLSRAESIVQLGSRIATIQLLRDELADLCRSYANGAVTTTTYTLRLSRLDKKMVTLLLSEAAGRPASSQAVILGDAAASSRPSATAEEVGKARQAVLDQIAKVSEKRKSLEEASDEDKKVKETELNAEYKLLEERQAVLMATERRLLDTSAGADFRSIVLNTPSSASDSGETLATLQENFLLQDDLTTFLDACISSLDLLRRPLGSIEQIELQGKQREVESTQASVREIRARLASAEARIGDASTDEEKKRAVEEFRKTQLEFDVAAAKADGIKQRYYDAISQSAPVSRFGDYCEKTALKELIGANIQRIVARRDLLTERRLLTEAQSRGTALRVCEASLKTSNTMDEKTKEACSKLLAGEASPARR